MSLNDLWEGAAENPYYPAVAKERQFLVASILLLTGMCSYQYNSRQLIPVASFRTHRLLWTQ